MLAACLNIKLPRQSTLPSASFETLFRGWLAYKVNLKKNNILMINKANAALAVLYGE